MTLIEYERRKRKLTQAQLALALSVNQPDVSRWERGAQPSWDHAKRLSAFLGLDVVDVMDKREVM